MVLRNQKCNKSTTKTWCFFCSRSWWFFPNLGKTVQVWTVLNAAKIGGKDFHHTPGFTGQDDCESSCPPLEIGPDLDSPGCVCHSWQNRNFRIRQVRKGWEGSTHDFQPDGPQKVKNHMVPYATIRHRMAQKKKQNQKQNQNQTQRKRVRPQSGPLAPRFSR